MTKAQDWQVTLDDLEASYRSAEHLGFDELIEPRETRDALLAGLQREPSSRQAAAEAVSRTVFLR